MMRTIQKTLKMVGDALSDTSKLQQSIAQDRDSSMILLLHRIEMVEKKIDIILEKLFSDRVGGSKLNFGFSRSFGVDSSTGSSTQPQQPTNNEPFSQPSPLQIIQPLSKVSPKDKSSKSQPISPKEPQNTNKSSDQAPTSSAQKPSNASIIAPISTRRFSKLTAWKLVHPILPRPQSSNPSSQSDMEPIQVFKEQFKNKNSSDPIDSSSSNSHGESLKIQLQRSGRHGLRIKIAKPSEPGSKDKPMNI